MIISLLFFAGISLLSAGSSALDLDIQVEGSGYLIVENQSGDRFYKTGDHFVLDGATGVFLDSRGMKLLGYEIDPASGIWSGTLSPVRIADRTGMFFIVEPEGTLILLEGFMGTQKDIYKIPLATFNNHRMLTRIGSDLFDQNKCSGNVVIGAAAAAGRGELVDARRVSLNMCMFETKK